MATRFASAKKALGVCDICGFTYRLRELKNLIVKNRDTNMKACPECWNPDQPQLMLGSFPVDDPQALRNPRPEQNVPQQNNIQWGWNPVGFKYDGGLTPNNLLATGSVGSVTVTT